MKTVILDAGTLGDDVDLWVFGKFGEVEIFERTDPADVAARIADADFAVLNKVKMNRDTVGEANKLKLVCVAATGYDNIDLPFMRSRGTGVCNVAGYSTDSVAQLTAAMALSLLTNLPSFTSYVADGSYSRGASANCLTPVYHEIAGKIWGIVGYGNIGRKVGEIARALGCRVIVNKRTPTADAECVTIDALCETADIISVHTPLTEETRGLISRARIAKMKSGAVVINVARGAVCDEAALCEAVRDGRIGGIGVDVYSSEPFREDSPYYAIRQMPNVCLTPHMAWGSHEARVRCVSEMALNIESFLEGGTRSRVDI